MQYALQAVLHLGLEPDHLVALPNQGAQIAHVLRWHPDAFQQILGQQAGQMIGGDLVRLHLGMDDERKMGRVNDGHRMGVGNQCVINHEGVGGRFHHQRILLVDDLLDPVFQVNEIYPARPIHLVEFRVYAGSDQVILVQIQSDEASGLGFVQGHMTPPKSRLLIDLIRKGRARFF